MENLITATRALRRVLCDQLENPNEPVDDCIGRARLHHPTDLKPDPIVLTFTFAAFCWLSHSTERQRLREPMNEVLEELAEALENDPLEEINNMHRHCLRNARRIFDSLGLTNARMMGKMEQIQRSGSLPEIHFHFP